MFIQNVEELQMRDLQVAESREARIKRRAGSDDEDEKDKAGGSDDEEEEGAKDSVFAFKPQRAPKPVKKAAAADADDDDEEEEEKPKGGLLGGIERVNPNKEKKAEKMMKVKDLDGAPVAADPDAGMNRKERSVYNMLCFPI
jgi:hypothetical protein